MFGLLFRLGLLGAICTPAVLIWSQSDSVWSADDSDLTEGLKTATDLVAAGWAKIVADPAPYLSALGTFCALFVYHKIKGRSTRESLEAAASRSTTVMVMPAQPAGPVIDPNSPYAVAMNSLAVTQLQKHLGDLLNRKEVLPKEIKEIETECAHAQKALEKAKELYEKCQNEYEQWEAERLDSVSESETIAAKIKATEEEILRLKQLSKAA